MAVYCDEVKNIQGILPLNGELFVVGAGPQGTGLYRISEPGTAPLTPPPDPAPSNTQVPSAAAPAEKPAGPTARNPAAPRTSGSPIKPAVDSSAKMAIASPIAT